ncbi:unnamed protein product [Gongylonema pulchrum]|uniref:Protein-lysine N-methyltransferase GPUH_LOCUS10829 n=1 Tax=Gongylonema pulchrum TaxID=637853 RepID=A0A183DQ38_9BILA|nr:unnamed protein product [Gongylonema pulchrum]
MECCPDGDDDDADKPTLSAEAIAALAEFYAEKNGLTGTTIDEDWQLSQFWYTEETAIKLAEECASAVDCGGRIACVSCPTLVDYLLRNERVTSGHVTIRLFEYDRRFLSKFPEEFVFYDYNEPLKIQEDCRNAFDLVVIDPPFLSDECLVKMAQTVRMLATGCQSKLLICTGVAMTDLVKRLFGAHKCNFEPKHQHNLANEFACFANYETRFL